MKPEPTIYQKKLIHWGCGKDLLNYDEEARRVMCWGETKKWSTKDMTRTEAAKVIAEIERRIVDAGKRIPWGARRQAGPAVAYPAELANLRGGLSQDQWRYVWDLWTKWRIKDGRNKKADDPEIYLKALKTWLKDKFGIHHLVWVENREASKIIKTLKEMVQR